MTMPGIIWGMGYGACLAFTYCGRSGLAVVSMGIGMVISFSWIFIDEFFKGKREFEGRRRARQQEIVERILERRDSTREDSGSV